MLLGAGQLDQVLEASLWVAATPGRDPMSGCNAHVTRLTVELGRKTNQFGEHPRMCEMRDYGAKYGRFDM